MTKTQEIENIENRLSEIKGWSEIKGKLSVGDGIKLEPYLKDVQERYHEAVDNCSLSDDVIDYLVVKHLKVNDNSNMAFWQRFWR